MDRELSQSARSVLQGARETARKSGCEQVEPEHLLSALLDDSQIAAALKAEEREQLCGALQSQLPEDAALVARGKLPLSPLSDCVLEFADEEAAELDAEMIEPVHLLIGLIREERGVAQAILRKAGIEADDIRKALRPAGENRLRKLAEDSLGIQGVAEQPINGSSHGLVESLFEESAPLPAPDGEFDSRLYVAGHQGWQAKIKRGWEKEYCYAKDPGEEGFHLLLSGEVYLQRGDEKFCLNCARRQRILTSDRLFWQFQKKQ